MNDLVPDPAEQKYLSDHNKQVSGFVKEISDGFRRVSKQKERHATNKTGKENLRKNRTLEDVLNFRIKSGNSECRK